MSLALEMSSTTRVDALVIGGGLLGCALAYYLASAGSRVLLAERGQINRQASGQNAGSLHYQLEYRMIENGDEQAAKAAEAMPLHLDAHRLWYGLEAELGADLGVSQTGGLMVAEQASDVVRLEKKVQLEQRAGLAIEMLDASQLRAKAPYLSKSVLAAAFCPSEGKADPRRCTFALAQAAMRFGAIVRSQLGVVEIARLGTTWRVAFDDGTVCLADNVIIAAGAWSGKIAELLGRSLPIRAVALMMTVTAAAPPIIHHLIQHVGRRLSMKQNEGGNIIIGGGWPAKFFHSLDGTIDLDRKPVPNLSAITGNMAAAAAVVDQVVNQLVLRIWTGVTSQVIDQLPLIGDIPGCPGCYIATGGSAFTLGPTYARILADKILGLPQKFDVSAYSPDRFGELLC